jgi:hypothetical protein
MPSGRQWWRAPNLRSGRPYMLNLVDLTQHLDDGPRPMDRFAGCDDVP